jgi:hypothetical protein
MGTAQIHCARTPALEKNKRARRHSKRTARTRRHWKRTSTRHKAARILVHLWLFTVTGGAANFFDSILGLVWHRTKVVGALSFAFFDFGSLVYTNRPSKVSLHMIPLRSSSSAADDGGVVLYPITTTYSSEFTSVVAPPLHNGNHQWCDTHTMSFPSHENPYAYHPASPVPSSYQCSATSSQSSASFGINSPLSTVSTTSSSSVAWLGASLLTMPIPLSSNSGAATTATVDNNTVDSFKTHIDATRERLSNGRALLLLEKLACENGNTSSNIASLKSKMDHYRETSANLRALALLNETSAAIQRNNPPATVIRARSYSTTHQVSSSGTDSMVPPEELAESTRRKPRALTEDDIRDPETIAGMKGNLHLEREEWAKNRALWLMGFGSIV